MPLSHLETYLETRSAANSMRSKLALKALGGDPETIPDTPPIEVPSGPEEIPSGPVEQPSGPTEVPTPTPEWKYAMSGKLPASEPPEVSHPDDPNPTPGHTEYAPIGEPAEGDIYVPIDNTHDDDQGSNGDNTPHPDNK